jgi:acyl carrier protein
LSAPIPQGIEVLVKKASLDAEFRELLLSERTEAARQIALELTPAEAMMLRAVPSEQLEAIIAQVTVPQEHRRAFLGHAAAAMLAALGVAASKSLASADEGLLPPGATPPPPPPPPRLIPPGMWGPAGILPDRPPLQVPDELDPLEKDVIAVVVKELNVKRQKEVTRGDTLVGSLGATAESLDSLRKSLERKFVIRLDWDKRHWPGAGSKPPGDKGMLTTVGDVVDAVRETLKEPKAIERVVIELVVAHVHVTELKDVSRNTSLVDDLGAEPKDLAALRKAVEKKFKISLPGDKYKKLSSVGNLVDLVRETVEKKVQPKKPVQTHGIRPDRPPAVGGIRPDAPPPPAGTPEVPPK